MSSALLPAVIVGIETPIGLAIIRDLGSRDVIVHGIARDETAIGLSSRYLYQGHIRASGEIELVQQLVELGTRLGEACLFAISEADIELLNRHRNRLHRYYRMTFPDNARMEQVLNKEKTYEIASKVGIWVPHTIQIRSIGEAVSFGKSLRFPVVLKWSNPHEVMPILSKAGLALEKAHYCYSNEELISYLSSFEGVNSYPLIQEYCPGYGLGQFILMQGGKAQYLFQHRRVHEWPPEGGVSSLCESVSLEHHTELMSRSIALLNELGWEGLAMVEYRHDPATGESALMEVNGRFWGSLPLAYHAGASFPWLSYQIFGLRQCVDRQPYRSGLHCRFMIPETKRLIRILFRQSEIADRRLTFGRVSELTKYMFGFLRPRTCYYIFQWKDTGPFIRDTLQILGRMISACLRRKF